MNAVTRCIGDVVALYRIELKRSDASGFYFVENGESAFEEIVAASSVGWIWASLRPSPRAKTPRGLARLRRAIS